MDAVKPDSPQWSQARIRPDEVGPYLEAGGADFVDDMSIHAALGSARAPDDARLGALLDKALALRDLDLDEAAALMAVEDPGQRERMEATALAVKERAYGNGVGIYAPLYLGNACANGCAYCGFKTVRHGEARRVLDEDEICAEVELLAGQMGHRQLLAVVGEHPSTGAKYLADSVAAIRAVQAPQDGRLVQIRNVGLLAPPLGVEDLRGVRSAGLGSYHVHQFTYDREAYRRAHPAGPKADFRWRLYAQHRAMDAGVAQVGLGVLAGLADWRFEGLALLLHARSLESRFGSGPAAVSLQRLEADHPASDPAHTVDDGAFLRLLTVLRLALPCVGLIVARSEGHVLRRRALKLGATITDAAPDVAVGAYHEGGVIDALACRQFAVGDPASLPELALELAEAGSLASFCSPGLQPGGWGPGFMAALRGGWVARDCRLNAILSFKEWLIDFADGRMLARGERLLVREILGVSRQYPESQGALLDCCRRINAGERGLSF